MTTKLEAQGGFVLVDEIETGKRLISVHKNDPVNSNPTHKLETAYSLPLIRQILDVKGLDFLCDEIRREEDPDYLANPMVVEILSYVHPEDFAGKRILDFGCGCGASTVLLSRLFPGARIVGIELMSDSLDIAASRARFFNLPDITLLVSPDSMNLPVDIGNFDAIILSAVFEHLLPDERPILLPEIWKHLNPGGILFIRETPFRYSPIESHTTGLPFINYLPDRMAHAYVRKLSKVKKTYNWESLLRAGICGGTEKEIIDILTATGALPKLVDPSYNGISSRVELWHQLPSMKRSRVLKRIMKFFFDVVWRTTGVTLTPYLSLAIKKI